MRSLPAALAAALSLFLAACASTPRGAAYPGAEPEPEAASLFPADAAVLPDDAIARILAHEWKAPASARLAVLRIGQRSPFLRWSGEFAQLDAQLRDEILGALRGGERVAAVSELPSLLVPREQTVGHLREAAARYRADLLLAWRGDCRTYGRSRLFSPDETKAYCDVEAVLLDVRTGIVPFAQSASRELTTTKAKDELSSAEASRRAELRATADALQDVTRGVLAFLSGKAPAAR